MVTYCTEWWYQMLYWYNLTFWGWARYCSKHVHVEDCNKCIKICASSWSLAKGYTKMHGQQNIKIRNICKQFTTQISRVFSPKVCQFLKLVIILFIYALQEELPWCIICNEDAAVMCLDCDNDLYCKSCFSQGHDEWQLQHHRNVPFTPKKVKL